MCGLVAAVGPSAGVAGRRALDCVDSRGIRRESVLEQPRTGPAYEFFAGHSRLPIVGLSSEWDQPRRVTTPSRSGYLVFVGEILDFREEMPDAECDVQLVEKAFWKMGPFGLRRNDGFWAVAFVEPGKITAFVDYLAQKPLYYGHSRNGTAIVASEPLAVALGIAVADGDPPQANERYLADSIKWGYCPDQEETAFHGVRAIRPGHAVELSASNKAVRQELVDPIRPRQGTFPSDLFEEIEEATRRRVLSADVPVGMLLSGGLDSSIVYTLATRHRDLDPVLCAGDEIEQAREVCPTVELVDCPELDGWSWTSPEECFEYFQAPVDLGSLRPQIALAKACRGRTNVVLTGDGADELFGGYGRALRYRSQASDVWSELVAWHLPRLDRVMSRNLIEVRSPFLARPVLELALGLSDGVLVNKAVLRDLFGKRVSADVAKRKKRPLRTPDIEGGLQERTRENVDKFRQWLRRLT